MTRRDVGRLVASLVAIWMVAACGSTAPTPLTSAAATPSPESTMASPSSLLSGAADVTGTRSCTDSPDIEGTITTANGVERTRGTVWQCTWKVSDPRLAGTDMTILSVDKRADGSADAWGMADISSDEGTWQCSMAGTGNAGIGTLAADCRGAGPYAGLVYHDRQTLVGSDWAVSGRIDLLGPSPSPSRSPRSSQDGTGAATCTQVLYATAQGPGEWRHSAIECAVTFFDGRLAGRELVVINVDVNEDTSATLFGTTVLWNERGTWEGTYAGTAGAGWPDSQHVVHSTLLGSGAYRGLRADVTWISGEGSSYTVSGTVGPSGG